MTYWADICSPLLLLEAESAMDKRTLEADLRETNRCFKALKQQSRHDNEAQ
jgi:hypothetical protein